MPNNKGYLAASTNDQYITPDNAVIPILKYIPEGAVVWCPFDLPEYSSYSRLIAKEGHKVISSHIDTGQDFFEYEPSEHYDVIISNPPFSQKDAVLERLAALDKPYAMLLPLPTLQGQKRFKDLVGTQALVFDKRINFYQDYKRTKMAKGVAFGSIYVCKDFLPEKLIFEELPEN